MNQVVLYTTITSNRTIIVEETIDSIQDKLEEKGSFIRMRRIQGKFSSPILLRKSQIKMIKERTHEV